MRALVGLSLLVASAAFGQSPSPSAKLELSLKAGGHFPQLFSRLETAFDGVLKVGFAPLLEGQLQLFADVGYAQPVNVTQGSDVRLSDEGADYRSTLTLRELRIGAGVSYFFISPSENLLPYAGAGVRMHLLRAEVVGQGGADFGENVETATRYGGALFGGVGYRIGPGALFCELLMSYVPVDEKVTGPANEGALAVLVGYGIFL